jgi:hypothetical protein
MRTSKTAELMAAVQTRLIDAGVYAIDAVTFVEHTVAYTMVYRDAPVEQVLERSFEYRLYDWMLGAFVYSNTPEGNAYWWDVMDGL